MKAVVASSVAARQWLAVFFSVVELKAAASTDW